MVVAIITRIVMAHTITPMTMAVPTTVVVVEVPLTLLPVDIPPLRRRPTLVVARSRDFVNGKRPLFCLRS